MAGKVQGEPGSSRGIRKCKEVLKNENISKGHRNQPEKVHTRQIWDNLSNK